jgi:hypothetical protein
VYGEDVQLEPERLLTPEQIGNECVQMSLLALKCVLKGKDPSLLVSPPYARVYRTEILKILLSGTPAGKNILERAGHSVKEALRIIQERETVRENIKAIFNRRNEINTARAAFDKITDH